MTGTSYAAIVDGSDWTFVHPDGRSTDYVLKGPLPPLTPEATVKLLNPKTGQHAHITVMWLTQAPSSDRSHWVPKDPAGKKPAADRKAAA